MAINNHFSALSEQHDKHKLQKSAGHVATGMNKESLFSTSKPQGNAIGQKSEDSVAFHTKTYGISTLGPNVAPSVKEAWQEAEEELGLERGGVNHLASLFAVQAEQRAQTGSSDLLGNTRKTAVEALKKALTHLEANEGKGNAKTQEYREQEKQFYNALLGKLAQ